MKFFIPYLKDDPAAAEAEWQQYLLGSGVPAGSRRVYSFTYVHDDGYKLEVTVGRTRKQYRPKTGQRGRYAEHERLGRPTGSEVSAIIDGGGERLYVWTHGPSSGEWENPQWVGRGEVTRIEYFDEPDDAPETGAT